MLFALIQPGDVLTPVPGHDSSCFCEGYKYTVQKDESGLFVRCSDEGMKHPLEEHDGRLNSPALVRWIES